MTAADKQKAEHAKKNGIPPFSPFLFDADSPDLERGIQQAETIFSK
jgi:hypothetical protein